MRESIIEKYLCDQVKAFGGETRKLQWIARKDAPDRLVALKGAHLVEVKAPGETPRPSQKREFKKLEKLGIKVWVLSTHAEVDKFLDWILDET